ncbi:MAG TPA: CBS domain-containing protein [Actinomycetota bacterium]|jgi:CBS domain-containing protein|nr:CBS domain-containing protein [Actinomycetota bacterium]
MRVRDVASSAVVVVGPEHTVRDAARMMAQHHVGSAVVTDAEQLAGILTERDVLKLVAQGADPDGAMVADMMTRDVVTVGPDWDLVEAAEEMARKRIRHLVVFEGGQLLGVLSVRDVLPHLLPERQSER